MNRSILAGGLLGGLASSAGMALTATSGWLIVRAAERPILLTLLTAIVMVRAFGIARPVFRYWERLVSHDAALGMLATRRERTYAALVPLTPARLGRRRRADVLTGVVDDLTDAVDASVRVTVPVISAAVAGVVAVSLATWFHPPVGAVMAGLALAITVICWLALRLESRSLDGLLAARADVGRVSELATSQATELAAVGGWPRALDWLDTAQRAEDQATRHQSRGRALAAGLFLVAVAVAVLITARIVIDTTLAAPIKALLVMIPVAAAEVIAPLTDAMRALARARGSERRLASLLGGIPAVDPDGAGDEPIPEAIELRAERLAASWDGQRNDLRPVDLTVAPGASIAVTGANGSGKSTLLAVFARHLDPSAGSYRWSDTEVSGLDLDESRARIAVVDDDPHLFATTLRNNLNFAAPDADDAHLEAALAAAGLGDLLTELPSGLDTLIGVNGRSLSGGERARLCLARAIASGRPVILLDEPVAHLDSPTAQAVLTDLATVHAEPAGGGPRRTMVMATHRPEALDLFDEVVALKK